MFTGLNASVLSDSRMTEIIDALPALPQNKVVDGSQDFSPLAGRESRLVVGDARVAELHLPEGCPTLVVEGNLTVDGVLKQDFRAGALLVLGDLNAGHIVTTAMIACTGDLTVKGALYGNCTNYETNVWGVTRADLLISVKEHYFCLWGGREIRCIVDVYGDTPNLSGHNYVDDTMHEIMHPDFGDGFDEDAVHELLKRNGSVLK